MPRLPLAALVLIACGGRPAAPPQPPLIDNPIAAAVDMMVEMGGVVMAAGDDCGRMAEGVDAWVDANGGRRARILEALARDDTAESRERYRRRLAEHLDVIGAMKVGVEGCANDAAFARAWGRLDR